MKQFRQNGAVGALLDEYEKALLELCGILDGMSVTQLTRLVDPKAEDPDCRSIQTILSHVVRSGYGYAIYIRKHQGELLDFRERVTLETPQAYQEALMEMFRYNEQLFADYPNLTLETLETEHKILTNWGQRFDVEQLMEHAIVHVLRHRRQIERFLAAV